MELFFYLKVDPGRCVLWITDMLSPYIYDGPDSGTPIIRNLYQSPRGCSIPAFIAANLVPKTELSTVGCFFDNQAISAMFMKIKYPVRDQRVDLSPAWSLSHIRRRSISYPLGSGMFNGMALLASP